MTETKSVELESYQLNDVAHIWFNRWKENRGVDVTIVTWNCFIATFLDKFFSMKLREAKAHA